MADDRPANDDLTAVVAELKRELEDLRSTTLARMSRSATGTVEQTLRTTPLPDTLFLQGQTVSRSDYPVLWQWVLNQGLVAAGLFGAGDGSTTFALPDLRGRAFVGADPTRPVGTLFGAQSRVITPANMAAHTHQAAVAAHGNHAHGADVGSDEVSHQHGFGTTGVGDHGGHHFTNAPGSAGSTAQWPTIAASGQGAHGHSGTTGNATNAHGHYVTVLGASAGGHSVSEVVVGQNAPFNVEQPSFCGNWLIYT